MKNLILIISLILFISCSNKQKEEEILFNKAVTMFKEHTNIDSLPEEAITKLNVILSKFPDSKLAKSIESEEKKLFVNNHGFLTYYEILELNRDFIKNEKAQILFDEACSLLSISTNEDSISIQAMLKIKTIIIEYPKTKLAKSLELNVQKIPLYNSEPLTFTELIELDDKLNQIKVANKNDILSMLMNLGNQSLAFFRIPISMGGGGNTSFTESIEDYLNLKDYGKNTKFFSIVNNKYEIIELQDDYLILQGKSKFWKIQMKVNAKNKNIELISQTRNN
ncbi:MAG: hypothetical protein KAU01_05615 [Candidatus Cloacimonetes bacterium]|nr:hypothetical protein [Candidatus Cloacimonadota bacterium]